MKLSISSLLFVGASMEDAIKRSAELGADGIEVIYDIPHFPPDYDQRKLRGLRELLDSYSLGVSVHGSFWDLNPASHHAGLRELSLEQIHRSIDACRALGGEIVVVHFGKCPVPDATDFLEGTKRRYSDFLGRCLPYAQDRGVTVALENGTGHPQVYPSTLDELKKLILELDGAKITLDVGHAHLAERRAGIKRTGKSIAEHIKGLRRYIVHVHIHDNHGRLDEHLPVGDGEIDFGPMVKALCGIGYEGIIVAELWNPKNPFETGRRGIGRVRELFGTSRTQRPR